MKADTKPRVLPAEPASESGASEITGLALVLLLLGLVLHELQWVLLPFVLSGLVAYLCTPLVDLIARRAGKPRALGAVGVFLVLVGLGAAVGFLGVPPLVREIERLATDIHGIFSSLAQSALGGKSITLFGEQMTAPQIADMATQAVRDYIGQADRIAKLSGAAFAGVFGVFLMLVLLFYLLLNGPQVMRGLLWLAPPQKRPLVRDIWRHLGPVLWRYFLGVLIVIIYATIAAYIGLGLVLGLNHAVFLAVLTGVLELIPVIGPGASALIAGLVAVRHATGLGPIIGYAIYAAALRLSIDQLLGPVVLGVAAELHPVLIIFCFLAGGALFGIPGIILAAPIALAVKTTLAVSRGELGDVPHADAKAEG